MFPGISSMSLWLTALLPAAMAQIRYQDASSGLTYNMGSVTTQSGTDLHINMSIPSSNGWGAVGIGNQMAGALMFVLLPDSTNGSTISLRTTSGEVMPQPIQGKTLNIMSASSQNNVYMASAVCVSCQSWSGGTLDISSTSQPFIYAIGPGSTGVSGSGKDATISMHSSYGHFNVDMTKAVLASADQANNSTSSSSPGGSSNGGSNNSGSDNSGVSGQTTNIDPADNLVTAHAAILGLAFVVLLPIGIVLVRVAALGWVAHAATQVLGAVLGVVGMAIAISMSMGTSYSNFSQYHQIVGLVAICIMILNVTLGATHHTTFKKIQRRSVVSYLHIWVGRVVIPLGIINVIFGFILTGDNASAIGYGVGGMLFYFAAVGAAQFLQMRNNKAARPHSVDSGRPEATLEQVATDKPAVVAR